MAAAWEEDYELPETESQKKKKQARNIVSLARTAKDPFSSLPTGPSTLIQEYLTGRPTTRKTLKPGSLAKALKMNEFKGTLSTLLRRGHRTRSRQHLLEEEMQQLNANRRQREAANAERRRREQESQERREREEHIRRGTTLPTSAERREMSAQRKASAKRKSRARRGKSPHRFTQKKKSGSKKY